MIKTETITRDDGVELIRTYSDSGMKIRQVQTGVIYDEAVDIANLYTYEETDERVEPDESTLADKAEAFDIITGAAT